jgi:Leucine-rich repeat (LRR) protein
VDELSTVAQMPEIRLSACLEYLASPHVRLIERTSTSADSSQKYRLPHDRIVASLLRLTDLILPGAFHARLVFERAYRAWLNERNGRFLLTGSELKKVLKNLRNFPGEPLSGERLLFLAKSLRRRRWRRLIAGGIALGLVVLGGVSWQEYHVQRQYQAREAKNFLRQASLPEDLYDHQLHLLTLDLTVPIVGLEWLHAPRLQNLSVQGAALGKVQGIPRSLLHLDLSECQVDSVSGLQKLDKLTELDLSGNGLQSVAGLERLPHLTMLNLSYNNLQRLTGLEKLTQLSELHLSGNNFQSLAELEKLPHLTKLDLSESHFQNLAGLENLTQLTELNLRGKKLQSLVGLENLARLEKLTKLDLGDNGLQSLAGLEKLTQLTELSLSGSDLQSLAGLEKLARLEKLTTLDLENNGLQSLAGLEKLAQLTELDLSGNDLKSLAGLERLTKLEILYAINYPIESLKPLIGLKRLKSLYLQGTKIMSFDGLPLSITELHLGHSRFP